MMMMMDRQLVRQCDMEVMRMAMLKHEETFRQQVHELHRLYRIQRELMSDLITTRYDDEPLLLTTAGRRSKQPRRALDLQLPADEYIVSADEDDDRDAELELTLAVGGRCAAGAGRRKSNRRRRQSAERQQRDNNAAGGSSPFGSDCSGASALSSPPPSSAEYYSDDGPAAAACQRAVAFDLGGEADGVMRQQHAPWLAQCQQYLSLRMT